ncbi:MAG: tripartite tricarboxylate transporter substrate-binding protein [Polaromonas sp.]|nr:tripartite tricarboxylate transporter substrate-binding protein [Polaromonas sp.]
MHSFLNRREALAVAAGALAFPLASAADPWPASTLTLTVPFAAGGGTDLLARALALKLAPVLGISVIVDNRAGAAGNIGAEAVVRDQTRHKLLFTTAAIAVNQSLYKNLRYNLVDDLQPVSMLTSSPLVLAVPANSDVKSVSDLRRIASAKAGGLDYGSPGNGTTSHLAGVVFAKSLGVQATHVPYKGAGPVCTALAAKEIDFALIAAVAATPFIRSGILRAIGIAGKQAPPGMENIPLLTKDFPQVEFDNWQALFAPRSQPRADVDRLHRDIAAILKTPDVIEKISADGALPLGLTPEKTAAMLATEVERYARIVREFGVVVS